MKTISPLFTIGEFSKLKGVSIDTLRYYDKIGLLKPELVDPSSSYRYYSHSQLIKYDIIKFFRSIDMSLKEIETLFKESNPQTLKQAIVLQRQLLFEKAQSMLKTVKTLDHISLTLDHTHHIPISQGSFYIKNLSERKIVYSSHSHSNTSTWSSQAYLELMDYLHAHELPTIYEGGYFHHLTNHVICDTTVFEVIEKTTPHISEQTLLLPAGSYLCTHLSESTRDSILSPYLQELSRYGAHSPHLLEIYLLDGSFSIQDRHYELQCLIS